MTDQTQRDIGRLEGKVDGLESEVAEIKRDVKSILSTVDQTRGGWRVMVAVSSISGAVGALVVKFMPFMGGLPK